ncbi:hypothetical protein XO10_01785 [Marinitoga sp. 1135]|uniref:hypothetical protein n=1 Tax=Marinitoga sp. 1135 TaxID=1643333 RepID=UPI001585EA9E|nr:hypothetical protein [Marinitoga sp. 1135]NUU95040.1 hypothetical protein [Marinitoga sp. 1135]
MKINTEIIDTYLMEKNLKKISNNKIFSLIENGKILFEAPPEESYQKIKNTYNLFKNIIFSFKPCNYNIWKNIFEISDNTDNSFIIFPIIGAPSPYEAMIRYDENGNTLMIFDIYLLGKNIDNLPKLKENISLLITHELAHYYIHQRFQYPQKIENQLKYLFFDEGFAHFLSYSNNIEQINWNEKKNIKKREYSYEMLKEKLKNKLDKNLLIKGITANNYWDKYIAISGMFAIIDFWHSNNKKLDSLKLLYKKGPEYLWNFWEINYLTKT